MGVADILKKIIDTFAKTSKLLLASFYLILISLICHIIGFATTYWLDGDGNQGLWNFCKVNSVYQCCSTIEVHMNQTDSDIPVFIIATRSCQCLGLIGGIVSIVSICICILSDQNDQNDQCKKCAQKVTMSVSFLTAVIILLGIVIYGAGYRHDSFTSELFLSYSFGFCTVAGILFIFPGVLIIIEIVKNNSVTPVRGNGNAGQI